MLDKANEDMALLSKICTSNHDFVRMLQNPVIHADKKSKVVLQIFGESVSKVTISFMNLMIRKRRELYLPSIAESFGDLYKFSKGIKTAYVTSAVSLLSGEKTGVLDILAKLTDKKIDLVEKTDEELVGGFVINIDDYQIDQSLATKIKQLKKDFEKNLFIKGF